MQFLIRSLDNELIVVALKGADDTLSESFTVCLKGQPQILKMKWKL